MFAPAGLAGERTVALPEDLGAELGGRGALLSGGRRAEGGEDGVLLSGEVRVAVGEDGALLSRDPRAAVGEDVVLLSGGPGAAGLAGPGVVLSAEPGAGDWWWLVDPLGDAWWDAADAGAEPGIEVDPELEALLGAVPCSEGDRQAHPPLSGAPGLTAAPDADVAGVPAWLSAGCLAAIAPGAGLAVVLERVDLASADDELLVETVAGAQRQAAFDHLLGALAAGELSRRASMNPLWQEPVPTRTCVAGDELAMRLGWSRPAAARLVRDGRALDNELLPVADAVREGLLDTAKLRVLTDRLHDRPDQLSWPVLEQVLPQAPLRTPTQLAADVDRALLAADPADAGIRLPKALANRHVCHPRRLPDGMAGLWAVLPATDAARIDGTLEATARAARAAGDPRTLDQLRADTLTDLATGTALLAGITVMPSCNGASRDTSSVNGTGGPSVGCDEPAGTRRAGGHGEAHRNRAGVGITRDGGACLQAGTTGVVRTGRDLDAATGSVPAGVAPVPPSVDSGQQADEVDQAPDQGDEATDEVDQAPDDRGREPDRTPEAWPVSEADRPPGRAAPGIRIPTVRIDVTVALSTLLGLDDQPAELAGLGPIPAEQARALAAGGTWRRIVTDPLTGTVLDVGRTRYRPPAPIAEHVIARDQVCAGPGCSVPGHRCDLDHTTEYHATPANGSPQRGTTSADNLGPLSHRCHRLKTDGGFTLRQIHPGVFEWHTPAGLTYRVTPGQHGHTQKLDNHSHPGYPDNPPF